MKLIIFDLDQTLVDFLKVHDDTVHQLFSDVFRTEARLTEIDWPGKSMTENMIELAKLKGIPSEEVITRLDEILDLYEKIFISHISFNASKNVLPGVNSLLKKLSTSGHFIALYTGDSPGIANIVLSLTGLAGYFKVSVFGTETKSRLELAKLAIKKAEDITYNKFEGKNVVIIGDSIRDVECGKQLNASTIAVATGSHSFNDLKKEKPDYVFHSLKDNSKVLEAIG